MPISSMSCCRGLIRKIVHACTAITFYVSSTGAEDNIISLLQCVRVTGAAHLDGCPIAIKHRASATDVNSAISTIMIYCQLKRICDYSLAWDSPPLGSGSFSTLLAFPPRKPPSTSSFNPPLRPLP